MNNVKKLNSLKSVLSMKIITPVKLPISICQLRILAKWALLSYRDLLMSVCYASQFVYVSVLSVLLLCISFNHVLDYKTYCLKTLFILFMPV
jgi:hypothetical protein